jgi:hypothetical protein
MSEPTAPAVTAPRSDRNFRRRPADIRLPAAETERQSRAAQAAFRALPAPGAAAAFLNTPHDDLGGRPIDIAIASDAGLDRVLAALTAA